MGARPPFELGEHQAPTDMDHEKEFPGLQKLIDLAKDTAANFSWGQDKIADEKKCLERPPTPTRSARSALLDTKAGGVGKVKIPGPALLPFPLRTECPVN